MNRKGLMKFGYLIMAIVLVSLILLTLKPVSPGTYYCRIKPTLKEYSYAYAKDCDHYYGRCPIFVDKNGDGNYIELVCKKYDQQGNCKRWGWDWDPGERPGVAGCECAEAFCTDWCQNDLCIWSEKIKVSKAVCKVATAMPHCTGAVVCPTEGTVPCEGEECGLAPAGACCEEDEDCITYDPNHPEKPKCVNQTSDCYGWEGYEEHATTLTENLGYACNCAQLGEPCGTSVDCCDNDDDSNPDYMCCNSQCSTSCSI